MGKHKAIAKGNDARGVERTLAKAQSFDVLNRDDISNPGNIQNILDPSHHPRQIPDEYVIDAGLEDGNNVVSIGDVSWQGQSAKCIVPYDDIKEDNVGCRNLGAKDESTFRQDLIQF